MAGSTRQWRRRLGQERQLTWIACGRLYCESIDQTPARGTYFGFLIPLVPLGNHFDYALLVDFKIITLAMLKKLNYAKVGNYTKRL